MEITHLIWIKFLEILWLILIKLIEVWHLFWTKIVITFIWAGIVYIFQLQQEAHTAISVLIILDGITGMAHSAARWDFSQKQLIKKFGIKLATYTILIITGYCVDLAIVKWHAEFWLHYTAIVFLVLTEASSITKHLEAFNIRVPFKNKINDMLLKMYNAK